MEGVSINRREWLMDVQHLARPRPGGDRKGFVGGMLCPRTGRRGTRRKHSRPSRAHYAAVYNAAKRLTRAPSEAQDLVQETYLRAYRFFHHFEPGTRVKAWLFTILRHTHINGYRQSARQLRRNTMEKPLARSKDAQMYRKSLSALQEEA